MPVGRGEVFHQNVLCRLAVERYCIRIFLNDYLLFINTWKLKEYCQGNGVQNPKKLFDQ
jgi:hypothetical protein